MSKIVKCDDPMVDAYIANQNKYEADQEGIWNLHCQNERKPVFVARIECTYREAVSAVLSDPRCDYYGQQGIVSLEENMPPNYSDYVRGLELRAEQRRIQDQLTELNRRSGKKVY